MRKGEDEFNRIITPSFADDDNDSATLAYETNESSYKWG